MNKVVTICVVVLLATLAFSGYAYTVYLPGLAKNSQGTSSTGGYMGPGAASLSVYLTDKPPFDSTLKYLLINVTSVTLRYEGSVLTTSSTNTTTVTTSTNVTSTSTTTNSSQTGGEPESQFTFIVPSSTGTNVNLTKLQGESVLLGTTTIPPGNVTGIVFHITGAKAFYTDGSSRQLKIVAEGKLMVPVHITVQKDGSTDLTIDITPNSIHTSQGAAAVLTPVVHVTVVSKGSSATTTLTTQTSITTSPTGNSTSTTTVTTNSNSTSTATNSTSSAM